MKKHDKILTIKDVFISYMSFFTSSILNLEMIFLNKLPSSKSKADLTVEDERNKSIISHRKKSMQEDMLSAKHQLQQTFSILREFIEEEEKIFFKNLKKISNGGGLEETKTLNFRAEISKFCDFLANQHKLMTDICNDFTAIETNSLFKKEELSDQYSPKKLPIEVNSTKSELESGIKNLRTETRELAGEFKKIVRLIDKVETVMHINFQYMFEKEYYDLGKKITLLKETVNHIGQEKKLEENFKKYLNFSTIMEKIDRMEYVGLGTILQGTVLKEGKPISQKQILQIG